MFVFLLLAAVLWLAASASAQRQMERLGRGMMVLHPPSGQAYVGWRLLAHDPSDIGFNVYRVQNGGNPVKLNASLLTNTTSFLDTTANFGVTNYWYVKPVTNGVEGPASGIAGLAANSPLRQYLPLPLPPVIGGLNPPYDCNHCWPADLDGDGEFDYVMTRNGVGTNGTPACQYAQVCRRDGTLLWQLNAGPNSANTYSYGPGSTIITGGDSQHMLAYDLDGDGKAEVVMKTSNGVTTVRPDGSTISSIVSSDTAEFISIFDGLTGVEKARCAVTNPWPADGVMYGRLAIVYADGVRPTLIFPCENRSETTGNFQECNIAFDYRDGVLTQRWFNIDTTTVARSHQLRQADVDHDGKDDLIQIGGVFRADDGAMLFDTDLVHGDRFHTTDMDPERPGLETYAIQQNHPGLLATALYESGTGRMIKRTYTATVADIGRGDSGDFDPRYLGVESFSTEAGMYDARGNRIPNAGHPFPTLTIWWDGDLRREFMSGAGSTLVSPTIDRWDQTVANPDGVNLRLYSIYNEGVHQGYAGRPPFIGDILGDWREEVILVANDYSELRIYCTKDTTTHRLYCLMQNAAYRLMCLNRGYVQSPYTDHYLGEGMQPPCPPPSIGSKLVWRGDAANVWNTTTACWRTNWSHAINPGTNPVAYVNGDTVLFDLTGSNHTAVTLSGTLTPGAVTVYSPKDFTFAGSGSLAGGMSLTKVGGGRLTLSGTNTFTGPTTVWEGPLVVNGQLTTSPVTVRGGVWLDGALAGTGTVSQVVTLHPGASVSPGNGTNSPGTLALGGGLAETGGAFNRFDLSNTPTGANDLLTVTGGLTFTGTNYIVINRLDGSLSQGGVYPLINYSGVFNGSISNLVVLGLSGVPVALTNPPGQIALVVKSYPAPATLTWTGGSGGNAWDLLTTSNWLAAGVKRAFAPSDTVRFDSIGVSNPVVNLVGDLSAAGVVVDSASDYTLTGGGALVGAASLTKSNSGTLTLTAPNSTFTGRTFLAGGTVVVDELDAVGFPSSLGNPPGGSTNLIFSGNSTLRVLGESYTDRGATLNSGTNTIEVANASDQVTMAGTLVGAGALRVLGPGTLGLTVSNSHTGGTIIKNGRLALGSLAGNLYGVGSGLVTFDAGRLSMMDLQASEVARWNMFVPAGTSGQLDVDGRSTVSGSLTGGGNFTVSTPYVRTDFSGNWSAFTGAVSVITYSGGATFRWNHVAGLPSARLSVGDKVSLQNRLSGTPTIALGELSGVAGSSMNAPGGNDGLSVRWTVGGLNTSATFAGNTTNNVGFNKIGSGTWTLSGTLGHSGPTTVSNGTLLVNGNAKWATNTFTAAAGGTLGGTGVIGGPVTIHNGAILSAGGTNAGTLTISNRLVLNSTSQLRFQLGAANDRVNVSGNLTLGGQLTITNSGTFTNGTYTLLTYGGTLSGTLPAIASAPQGFDYTVATNTPGEVRLVAVSAGNPPLPPLVLSAMPSNSTVFLDWTSVSNATTYNLQRALTNGGPFAVVAGGTTGTHFTDSNVVNGTTYYYVVTAVNGAGESGPSPQAAVTPPGIPNVPSGLVATPGDQQVGLEWNPAQWASGYNVKGSTTNGGPYVTLATNVPATAHVVSGLSNGTPYYFVVSAVNASGESDDSPPASATPVPPVVAYWTNLVTSAPQNWDANANWTNVALFPNEPGIVAMMTANIAGNQTNRLNQAVTVGALQLGDANNTHAYTLAANGGSLIFDNGFSTARLVQVSTSKGDTLSTPITLNNSLLITNASANTLTLTGPIVSSGAGLVIEGGKLRMTGSNAYTGTTVLSGTLVMANDMANNDGLGSGTITLNGGTLTMYDNSESYNSSTWNLQVPSGQTGRIDLDSRCELYGTLDGGGTLNLTVDYVRGTIKGNWSAFEGSVRVSSRGGTSDFRVGHTAGFPDARVSLAADVQMYSRASSGAVIPIGELAATPGAILTAGFGSSDGTQNAVTWRVGGLNTDATNAATILGTTKLIKEGGGTWTLTGDNTQTGGTTVTNGTLRLDNPSGSPTGTGVLEVGPDGLLTGNALVDGPATIRGILAPGTGSNTLTFNSGLTLGPTATTILHVRRSPGASDLVSVVGSLSCGGLLVVTNIGSAPFVAGDILTPIAASAFAGTFAGLILPPLDGGLTWDVSELYTLGQLKVLAPPPPGSFEYQMTLTFPGYTGSAGLTNIPLLVVLSPALPGFDYSQFATPDGSDLRFRLVGGGSLLNHEIDTWDPEGESRVWVQVPTLTTNTAILMSWGNTALTNPPASLTNGATWSQNYLGVWHLRETTGPHLDSSPALATARVTQVSGQGTAAGIVGVGDDFNTASSDYVSLPNMGTNAAVTVECWVNLDSTPGAADIGLVSSDFWAPGYTHFKVSDTLQLKAGLNGGGSIISPTNLLSVGAWFYAAYTVGGAGATDLKLYHNAALIGSAAGRNDNNLTDANIAREYNGRYLDGRVDEVRLSNVARSSNWLWAVYQNIASNSTFNHFSPASLVSISNPPPGFLAAAPAGNGVLRLSFVGPNGADYELRATTNLTLTPVTAWELLSGGTFGTEPLVHDDPQAGALDQRFYILRLP
jgi:autotransporter-associated beta strand protein